MSSNPFVDPFDLAKKWKESMNPPQTFDEMRRKWLRVVSKDELWCWHDEIVEELKRR